VFCLHCIKIIMTINIAHTPLAEDEITIKTIEKAIYEAKITAIVAYEHGEINIVVSEPCFTLPLLTILKTHEELKFKMLIDICGADYLTGKAGKGIYTKSQHNIAPDKRFEVVYHLLSFKLNKRVRLKVCLNYLQKAQSITALFSAACWFERETFDMYGIEFENAEDLRRILTDYNFEGFPLRKDFPLTGFKQIRYDKTLGKIVEEPVNLQQEYRNFDFESPWKGAVYSIKNQ